MAERSGHGTARTVGVLAQELPIDRLLEEAQNLLTALGEQAVTRLADKAGDVAERLTEYAEDGGGPGLAGLLAGGRSLASGHSPLRAVLSGGFTQVKEKAKEKAKEKVKGALGGGKDGAHGGRKIKVTNIVESIDVGVPVSIAYNQWTQFEEFPDFMKKVERVKQLSETELDWKAQIFLSHRAWKSTVIEQIPDERIVWRSQAEKGRVDGAVTFHEVTPDLTKIILILQYHPQGLFEHTGNMWRAQGRRARLELKHFQRHVMTESILHSDEIRGWRGEVVDGEVVRGDEEVRQEEEHERQEEEHERQEEEHERQAEEPESREPESKEPEAEEPEGRERERKPREEEHEGEREREPEDEQKQEPADEDEDEGAR